MKLVTKTLTNEYVLKIRIAVKLYANDLLHAVLPTINYATFEELERGFEEDHQIEIVVQAAECEWDSPPGPFEPVVS